MKHFLKRYKEIIFLIGVVLVVGFASHDLFSDQQQNSGLINSGTMLTPSNFSGRTTCEVPIPSVSKRATEGTNTIQKKTRPEDTANQSVLSNN